MIIPQYNPAEIESATRYAACGGLYGIPPWANKRYVSPITPKENFKRMMRGEKTFWQINVNTDFNCIQPSVMLDAVARNEGGIDWFGVDWKYVPAERAAMVRPGTKRLKQFSNWRTDIEWPNLDEVDWEGDYERNYKEALDPDRPTYIPIINGLFERLICLVNFEDALYALMDEPEEVAAFFDKLCDWYSGLFAILKRVYDVDVVCFHDDMGSQKSTFFSPELYKELMVPAYRKITGAAHDLGIYVDYHSCGKIDTLIPFMIESGFDMWEGQAALHDMTALVRQYGDKLVFLNVLLAPLDDDEAIAFIKDIINERGQTQRYIMYFAETRPDRKPYLRDTIYEYSRRIYSR